MSTFIEKSRTAFANAGFFGGAIAGGTYTASFINKMNESRVEHAQSILDEETYKQFESFNPMDDMTGFDEVFGNLFIDLAAPAGLLVAGAVLFAIPSYVGGYVIDRSRDALASRD